jgi:hypothetical protein
MAALYHARPLSFGQGMRVFASFYKKKRFLFFSVKKNQKTFPSD